MEITEEEIVNAISALSAPNRLRMVFIIANTEEWIHIARMAEMLRMTATNTARQLGILEKAQILKRHKSGTFVSYELNRIFYDEVLKFLQFKKEEKNVVSN